MAWNPHADSNRFWDFIQSMDPNTRAPGAGIDHTAASGFPFAAGPPFNPEDFHGWGGRGGWGAGWGGPWGGPWGHAGHHHRHGRSHARRHGRRHSQDDAPVDDHDEANHTPEDSEKEDSPDTMRDAPEEAPEHGDHPPPPPPPGGLPHHPPPPPPAGGFPHPPPPPGFGFGFGPRGRGFGCRGARRGGRGRHGPGPHAQGPHGHHGPHGPHAPRGPPPYEGPFDFRPIMHAFATHPFAQAIRDYVEPHRNSDAAVGEEPQTEGDSFVPPVDIFNTEAAYVLHVSLPGAAKEDIGVNWDPEKGQLNIAGVIYRPGDEAFLQTLTSTERRVGMFERSIKLPPAGTDEKEDIDGFGAAARMENGILIVTVPKTEKEWTEVHKVDIE